MIKTDDGQERMNPFAPDRPAVNRDEFVGREDAFQRIQQQLDQSAAAQPVALCGMAGIGKTSLLRRLGSGDLGDELNVLYVDFQTLSLSRMSAFLWDLAKSIMSEMESQGLAGPTIEKRMLVLNPQPVFRQRFWQSLLTRALETPLLLAWDNFDALAENRAGDAPVQAIRAYLHSLLDTRTPLKVLVTVTGRLEAMAENSLAPFRLAQSHRLTKLNHSEALQIVQGPAQWDVFTPVADFIYELTAGHPGDIQRLCHSLFERHQARGNRQVAAADVVASLRHELKPSDFAGTVHRRLAHSSFAINMSPNEKSPS